MSKLLANLGGILRRNFKTLTKILGVLLFPLEILATFELISQYETSDVNICVNLVDKFLVCYGSKPHGRFSNPCFGKNLTFS